MNDAEEMAGMGNALVQKSTSQESADGRPLYMYIKDYNP